MLVDVAVGLVINEKQQLLIALRPSTATSYPSTWEFPGGKVEQGEVVSDALIRELKEEVNIDCVAPELWFTLEDSVVRLHIFWVKHYDGQAQSLEGQPALAWVDVSQLSKYTFPPSNQIIIKKIEQTFILLN